MLHAFVYKYIIDHCQANELKELREKFCHRLFVCVFEIEKQMSIE